MKLATLAFVCILSANAQSTILTLGGETQSGGRLTIAPWFSQNATALASPLKPVTISKNFELPGHFYVIRWTYNPNFGSMPATYPPGPTHYDATVSVFEVLNGSGQQIGKEFSGQFTNWECREDDPAAMVESALETAGQLTPDLTVALEKIRSAAALEAMPVYEERDGVLIITEHGRRHLKEIKVGDKPIWKRP